MKNNPNNIYVANYNYPVVRFSKNWNKKLTTDYFTTVRMASARYVVGNIYRIECKTKLHNGVFPNAVFCRLIAIQKFDLNNINEFDSYLDSGMQPILFKMFIQDLYGFNPIFRLLFEFDITFNLEVQTSTRTGLKKYHDQNLYAVVANARRAIFVKYNKLDLDLIKSSDQKEILLKDTNDYEIEDFNNMSRFNKRK